MKKKNNQLKSNNPGEMLSLLAEIASEWDNDVSDRAYELENGIDRTFLEVISPLFSKLLKQYNHGSKVIDLGCGLGYLSDIIAHQGYMVHGIDVSKRSIDYASERFPGARFDHASIFDYANREVGQYSVGIANMVFHNMPDLEANLKSIFKLLTVSGVLLISIPHPVFWFQTRQFASEYDYSYLRESTFKIPFKIRNGMPHKSYITYLHRPLSRYFAAVSDAGFKVSALIEPENLNSSSTADLLFWVCSK